MALPPFDINQSKPGDSDLVSQFPADERQNRDIIESWIATEHGTSGHHALPIGTTTQRDAVTDWEQGSLFVNTSHTPNRLQVQTAAQSPFSWTDFIEFPSGTKMVFRQASAPPGWTQDTSANDRVLRIVSGTPGADGGSWTISGLSATTTVAGHALTVNEMPSHNHPGTVIPVYDTGGSGTIAEGGGSFRGRYSPITIASQGGNQPHSHNATTSISSSGSWRPAYIDVIVATKN